MLSPEGKPVESEVSCTFFPAYPVSHNGNLIFTRSMMMANGSCGQWAEGVSKPVYVGIFTECAEDVSADASFSKDTASELSKKLLSKLTLVKADRPTDEYDSGNDNDAGEPA